MGLVNMGKTEWLNFLKQLQMWREKNDPFACLWMLMGGYLAIHFPGGWWPLALGLASLFGNKEAKKELPGFLQRFPVFTVLMPILIAVGITWFFSTNTSFFAQGCLGIILLLFLLLFVWIIPSVCIPLRTIHLPCNTACTCILVGAVIGGMELFWGIKFSADNFLAWNGPLLVPLLLAVLGAVSVYLRFICPRVAQWLAGSILGFSLIISCILLCQVKIQEIHFQSALKAIQSEDIIKVARIPKSVLRNKYQGADLLVMAAGLNGNSLAIVEELLSLGVDVNQPTRNGDYALIAAAGTERPGVVSLLLQKGAFARVHNGFYTTPLMRAVAEDDEESVRLLLRAGANPNAKDKNNTPVMLCGTPSFEIYKMLLEAGADVNAKDAWGETALLRAVSSRKTSPKTVQLLLEAGADVNARNFFNDTPLLRAVAIPSAVKTVELLLAHGADPHVKNNFGYTAWAMLLGPREYIEHPKPRLPIAKMLLKAGVDVNGEIDFGFTPLYFAKHYNHSPKEDRLQVIRLLEKAGAKETLPSSEKTK